jgi:hypothetical protein
MHHLTPPPRKSVDKARRSATGKVAVVAVVVVVAMTAAAVVVAMTAAAAVVAAMMAAAVVVAVRQIQRR